MPDRPTTALPERKGLLSRFFAWLRSMLRKRDNGGTPPNIYPLY